MLVSFPVREYAMSYAWTSHDTSRLTVVLLALALSSCGETTEPEENPPAPPASVGSASYRATSVEGAQWTSLDPGGVSTYEGWIIAVESVECLPGQTGVDTLIVTNGTTLEMSIDGHFVLSLLTANACSAGVQHLSGGVGMAELMGWYERPTRDSLELTATDADWSVTGGQVTEERSGDAVGIAVWVSNAVLGTTVKLTFGRMQ
jgi:hypothetical protein